jgi:transposase
MSKYTEAFKRSVVVRYLVGDLGSKAVAQTFGLDHGTVRNWVAIYGQHGDAGLARKLTPYSAAFRLSVLQHMWDNHLSYRETAAFFNIRNRGCLPVWQRLYRTGGIDGLAPRRRGRPKAMSEPVPGRPQTPAADDQRTREELLAELKFLRMENVYLKKYNALVQAKTAPTKRK